MNRAATSVTITDPFVKYTSLIATGAYSPDAAQYRLAHHLQSVYVRLKDYTPSHEYRSRLQRIAKAVDPADGKGKDGEGLASPSHPIRRNPLFARFFQNDEGRDSLALARVLTSSQAALHVDSPKGLFLSGDVGTGKSMLLDLLAEGLPTRRKKRWHFNTFMLHTFSRLEEFRKSRLLVSADHPEYSLLWMAKELMETSPILFLDEFQLPDRAASKIMGNLLVAFFQLGGVLVASSNRMPEELEKAAGGYYSPPATGGLVQRVLGLSKGRSGGELFGQSSDFATFLEVLKARCDFWHMEGTQDWRRRESRTVASAPPRGHPQAESSPVLTAKNNNNNSTELPREEFEGSTQMLAMYFSQSSESEEVWRAALQHAASLGHSGQTARDLAWKPSTLTVYGRELVVSRQQAGVSCWDFADLVSSLGPADYVTLASNYHTFVIDQVPVLNLSMKNEARRFITLLDALYESRCKLVIRAEAGPDDLFFPETKTQPAQGDSAPAGADRTEGVDATYSETIAEVYQDQVSPFRPNISTYSESLNSTYDPDQDSDFGKEQDTKVDFNKTGAFTGEDERFAYKRATSRLWELCSAQWHARTGDWWQPLPKAARHWEGNEPSRSTLSSPLAKGRPSEITMGESNRRQLRQITLLLGFVLVIYCLVFVWNTPANNKGSRRQRKPPPPPPPAEILNSLSLGEEQCDAYFPGLTKEIDNVVAEGPFQVKQTGDTGPLQGRIKDGQIYIIHAQRKSDLSQEMMNSRTASLHQLHRALLTSPTPIPDTYFTLNFQDQPFGTAWAYSRHADPEFRSKDPNVRAFLMPHFSFWAWNLPFIGSMARAAQAIADLEASYQGRWEHKIAKAVWRGTTWFNSIHSPRLRQNLVAAARGQPWADVEALDWKSGGGNASNALPIEGFCRYKYVVHTEGVAYSGRFQFLQMCASVVLTPPIQWMQHVTHLARPLFSSELNLGGKGWTPSERVKRAWPVRYKPEEANIVFVAPDWSDLGETVAWLEEHPDIAEGIARRQRDMFVGGGYFSPAAEACYWRALVRGWAKMARTEGQGWEDTEGVTFEAFSLKNGA
ncbi:AFG1-like ATPase-domain-containing protein [Chaetomidium leptoderma]|uniref:AFG1-like ATPase-domain-containing protein n=1 Tax=Chaetomidium leptoderma TaxID=669021 RepID=A0AAN6VKX5_9PEZI|nr:AFG1-like ATPase-domain-containing protein [Chaetomidium leptoderma]